MKKMGKVLLLCALALGSTTLTGCGVESIVNAVGGGGGGGGGGGFNLGGITNLLGGFLKFPNIGIGNVGNNNTVNVGNETGPSILAPDYPADGPTSITDSTVGGVPSGTVESAPLDPISTDDGSVPVVDNGGGSGRGWDPGEFEPGTEYASPPDTSSVGEG